MIKAKDYKRITEEVFRLMDEGLHVVDAEGKTIIYNEAMANMEKMNRSEVLRKPFREVFSYIEEGQSTMLQALKHGKITSNIQQTYQNIDGKEITTINSTYPLILDGQITGAVEIARNITDVQKLSHTILKFQEETLEPKAVRDKRIKAYSFDMIIGESKGFVQVVNRAKKAAQSDASVLICGDTGTGKELFAQSIHYHSNRKGKPLLAQNCAALPETLLEGILFGTAKGGFTGAMDRAGLFEQADGTLLLDEVSAMPYELQGKLLRVLQEDYLRRVGGTKDIPFNVRIIATINEPAEKLIEKGLLRKDLYYRLAIININVPPLRERRDDILLLAEKFMEKHNKRFGKELWMISEPAKKKLLDHDYPGNVRELENIIMAGVSMADNEHVLTAEHLSIEKSTGGTSFVEYGRAVELGLSSYLQQIEKNLIEQALISNGGNISHAARQLNIKRQTLQYKMKK
jgi:arginine utilization regulatory protein